MEAPHGEIFTREKIFKNMLAFQLEKDTMFMRGV